MATTGILVFIACWNEFLLALDSEILDRNALDKVQLKEGNVLHIFPPISGG